MERSNQRFAKCFARSTNRTALVRKRAGVEICGNGRLLEWIRLKHRYALASLFSLLSTIVRIGEIGSATCIPLGTLITMSGYTARKSALRSEKSHLLSVHICSCFHLVPWFVLRGGAIGILACLVVVRDGFSGRSLRACRILPSSANMVRLMCRLKNDKCNVAGQDAGD